MMVAVFVVNVSFNLHNIYGVFAVIDVHILLCTITNIKFKIQGYETKQTDQKQFAAQGVENDCSK